MSDLLPTKEQEAAAKAYIDRCFGDGPGGLFEEAALLLAEREEPLRAVICWRRECLHNAIMDEDSAEFMRAKTYVEALRALRETVQYEVVE